MVPAQNASLTIEHLVVKVLSFREPILRVTREGQVVESSQGVGMLVAHETPVKKVSVLKARVRAALRSHPSVLAYADAPPSDGGTGAVYVLLRK